MVGRPRRGKPDSQRGRNRPGDFVWGRRVVIETLRAGRWPIHDLWLAERVEADEAEEVRRLAEAVGVETVVETADALRRRCHTDMHQGFLARVGPFPFENLEELLADPPRRAGAPLWLLLDSVQDPFNLGAILRAAEVFGVDGVLVSGDHHAPINGHVARSSAGAVNHLRIARAENLVSLVMRLRRDGVQVLAAAIDDAVPAGQIELVRPTAIVIGNEGHGVGPDVLAVCDGRIGIEQSGQIESLNAAVAAGVLLYEADRQRRGESPG